MIGGIIGDIIGSVYEDGSMKSKEFPLFGTNNFFTDDSVLTVATADCLLNNGRFEDYYFSYSQKYPSCGYGTNFMKWVFMRKYRKEYIQGNGYGNGSAMRVGPIGWAYNSLEEVLQYSRISASCTHNHEEAIKGAQTIAACVLLARKKASKEEIKSFVENRFNYNVSDSLEDITAKHIWNATCQQTVPQAIVAFIESTDFEDSIRNAIAIGGDSDTIACMTGAISQAFYGVPQELRVKAYNFLPNEMIDIIVSFEKQFGI